MRIGLVKDGKPAGHVDIPDEIFDAAFSVHSWMMSHMVTELCGLSCPAADAARQWDEHKAKDRG